MISPRRALISRLVPLALALGPVLACATTGAGSARREAALAPDAAVPPAEAAMPPGEAPAAGSAAAATGAALTRRATVALMPLGSSQVRGKLFIAEHADGSLIVTGTITGFPAAGAHGMHVHEVGDCTAADGTSAGGHFNPTDQPHGAPHEGEAHVGDLGNVLADASGRADVAIVVHTGATLGAGATSVLHRSVIVHRDADDLATQPSGGSGDRVACGIVVPVT